MFDDSQVLGLDPDKVLFAVAEDCTGPGWSNSIVWVVYRGEDGSIEIASMQPDEQTSEIRALHPVAACASSRLTALVQGMLRKHRRENPQPE